jgi:hypothetical protein
VLTWQEMHDVDVTCAPTDELAWQLKVDTNSTTPVTVVLTWQDPGRTTRLTVPFELPITGAATGRHNDLSGRGIGGDKDVASTDPTKSDTCHPWSALGPAGRMHTKYGGEVSPDGNGCLTMPSDVNNCVVTGDGNIIGIATAGWLPGDLIALFFTGQPLLVNFSGDCPSGFSPLVLGNGRRRMPRDTRLLFRLSNSSVVWNLESVIPDGIDVGTISAGILTLPPGLRKCRVSVSAPTSIVGIDALGIGDGDPIMIDFYNASTANRITLVNMADVSGFPDALPLGLQAAGSVAGGMEISGPTTVWFWIDWARERLRFDRKMATT